MKGKKRSEKVKRLPLLDSKNSPAGLGTAGSGLVFSFQLAKT